MYAETLYETDLESDEDDICCECGGDANDD